MCLCLIKELAQELQNSKILLIIGITFIIIIIIISTIIIIIIIVIIIARECFWVTIPGQLSLLHSLHLTNIKSITT